MKEGIHPNYQPVVFVDANTGKEYITRSTKSSAEKKTIELIPIRSGRASSIAWIRLAVSTASTSAMAAVLTSPLQSVRLARLLRSRLKKKLNLLKFWGLPN